uniref:Uncharacterized protein n=1 Tax=Glossina pallidipes TaxID=7398 RepID=A0A1A9ZCH9_GLOPL
MKDIVVLHIVRTSWDNWRDGSISRHYMLPECLAEIQSCKENIAWKLIASQATVLRLGHVPHFLCIEVILTTSINCDKRKPILTVKRSELLPTGRIKRLFFISGPAKYCSPSFVILLDSNNRRQEDFGVQK